MKVALRFVSLTEIASILWAVYLIFTTPPMPGEDMLPVYYLMPGWAVTAIAFGLGVTASGIRSQTGWLVGLISPPVAFMASSFITEPLTSLAFDAFGETCDPAGYCQTTPLYDAISLIGPMTTIMIPIVVATLTLIYSFRMWETPAQRADVAGRKSRMLRAHAAHKANDPKAAGNNLSVNDGDPKSAEAGDHLMIIAARVNTKTETAR